MTKMDVLINLKPIDSFSLGKNVNSLQGAKNYWICWGFVFLFQNIGRSSICTACLKMYSISIYVELSRGLKPDSKPVYSLASCLVLKQNHMFNYAYGSFSEH